MCLQTAVVLLHWPTPSSELCCASRCRCSGNPRVQFIFPTMDAPVAEDATHGQEEEGQSSRETKRQRTTSSGAPHTEATPTGSPALHPLFSIVACGAATHPAKRRRGRAIGTCNLRLVCPAFACTNSKHSPDGMRLKTHNSFVVQLSLAFFRVLVYSCNLLDSWCTSTGGGSEDRFAVQRLTREGYASSSEHWFAAV